MLTINLLRQALNVTLSYTHLYKVQLPSIYHIYNTNNLSSSREFSISGFNSPSIA